MREEKMRRGWRQEGRKEGAARLEAYAIKHGLHLREM